MKKAIQGRPLLATLPLQIADQLSARIVDAHYSPGERLLETELSLSYEVSRATVREALRLLEQRGLVRILPQRGARVTMLSDKELDDLFEVRASLLGTASRLAAERCTPEAEAALKRHLSDMRKVVRDAAEYVRASAAMVELVVQYSGNDVLVAYVRDFALRIGRYTRLGLATPARRRASLQTWEGIVDAISARDAKRAAELHTELALANRAAAIAEFRQLQGAGS